MVALVLINLSWLIVDSAIRGSVTIRHALEQHAGGVFGVYETYVHDNFALVDMAFVAVFLCEFFLRWMIAAKRRVYHRWFFYPLIHWYDLLGCIPIGSMRFLRILRLVAIVHRMHRLGLIDIKKFYLYRVFAKYREVVTEEISDRVVVHVLSDVQREITQGSPVVERIWSEVVAAHKDAISAQLVKSGETMLRQTLDAQQPALHAYTERVLNEALSRSQHVFHSVDAIPILGRTFVRQIEDAIRVIVNNVISELVDDAKVLDLTLVKAEVEKLVNQAFADRDVRVESLMRQTICDALEIVKEEVKVQQWKLREASEASQGEEEAPA